MASRWGHHQCSWGSLDFAPAVSRFTGNQLRGGLIPSVENNNNIKQMWHSTWHVCVRVCPYARYHNTECTPPPYTHLSPPLKWAECCHGDAPLTKVLQWPALTLVGDLWPFRPWPGSEGQRWPEGNKSTSMIGTLTCSLALSSAALALPPTVFTSHLHFVAEIPKKTLSCRKLTPLLHRSRYSPLCTHGNSKGSISHDLHSMLLRVLGSPTSDLSVNCDDKMHHANILHHDGYDSSNDHQ